MLPFSAQYFAFLKDLVARSSISNCIAENADTKRQWQYAFSSGYEGQCGIKHSLQNVKGLSLDSSLNSVTSFGLTFFRSNECFVTNLLCYRVAIWPFGNCLSVLNGMTSQQTLSKTHNILWNFKICCSFLTILFCKLASFFFFLRNWQPCYDQFAFIVIVKSSFQETIQVKIIYFDKDGKINLLFGKNHDEQSLT